MTNTPPSPHGPARSPNLGTMVPGTDFMRAWQQRAKVRALSEGRFNVSVEDLRATALPAIFRRAQDGEGVEMASAHGRS